MSTHLGMYTRPGGPMLPDDTGRLTKLIFSTGEHGDEACQFAAPMSLTDAFRRYDWPSAPHAIVRADGTPVFQGRVEDVAIRGDGIDATAYGYSRALGDAPYTALWSTTKVGEFRPMIASQLSTASPELYVMDTNNRLYITPQKNGTLGSTGTQKSGELLYQVPDGSSRNIIGVSFDYIYTLPAANWRVQLRTRDAMFAQVASPWNILAGGATGIVNGSFFGTFAAVPTISFAIRFDAADAVFLGETGSAYLIITNLRLVTTTTNMVNTTHTVARGAGVNVTATVGSTANMYVGQRLGIGASGASLGESVIVKQILNSTQFVADFTAAAAVGLPVQAHVIYADEIVEDIIGDVSALNSTQLLSDVTQVQNPGTDLFDELYEDMLPSRILDRLTTMGDNATPPRRWEWGVSGDRRLYFRPESSATLTWYVDATAVDVQRTLEQLVNSAYAVYQDASNRALRGAISTDAESVARYGLTRRQAVETQTTSLVQANIERDALIDDKSTPTPRFGLTFSAVYNASGGRAPIWLPRAGDTIVIRNLPPTISTDIDQIRTFRIARTSCDLIARTLTVEPAVPLPTMAALIARGLRGQTT